MIVSDPRVRKSVPPRSAYGRVLPVPSYHDFAGAQTTVGHAWTGIWGGLQVQTPYCGTQARPRYSFVAPWYMVLASSPYGLWFTQVGWAQTNWTGSLQPHVFQYDSAVGAWEFFDQYSLIDGQTYDFALFRGADVGGQQEWATAIWWDNAWQTLTVGDFPAGDTLLSEQVEVYNDLDNPAFLPYFDEMTNSPSYISDDYGSGSLWTAATPTQGNEVAPYCFDAPNPYYLWDVWRCS